MFLRFINAMISNKQKLLLYSKLPVLFCQPHPLGGKIYPPPFFGK